MHLEDEERSSQDRVVLRAEVFRKRLLARRSELLLELKSACDKSADPDVRGCVAALAEVEVICEMFKLEPLGGGK